MRQCDHFAITILSTQLFLLSSQGNQKQRRLPGVDPVFPGYVLIFSPFPGLVRQLAELAGMDSVNKKPGKLSHLWHRVLWHIQGNAAENERLSSMLDLKFFMRIQKRPESLP